MRVHRYPLSIEINMPADACVTISGNENEEEIRLGYAFLLRK
jgi:hypothetical protein